MIDHWFDDLHFTSDIILEACSRTLTQTQNPSFQYANKILESWHASGIHHLNEIRELDQKQSEDGKSGIETASCRDFRKQIQQFLAA